jgi:pectin methylesterase-like acyl-CoA thioesterase
LPGVCVVLLAFAGTLAGATLHVDLVGGGDFTSIQAAINAAISGVDQIEVAPGTYTEAINFNGKAVRLYGSGGPAVTMIDGGGGECTVVRCTSGEGSSTILDGFTITGGNSSSSLYIGQ